VFGVLEEEREGIDLVKEEKGEIGGGIEEKR
jgi:hypothetical protein